MVSESREKKIHRTEPAARAHIMNSSGESMRHTPCRKFYRQVLADVRKHFKTELIKKAWVWTDRQNWEFHGPTGEFFSLNTADCASTAKAAGWSQLLVALSLVSKTSSEQLAELVDPRSVLASLRANARPAKKIL